MNFKLIYLYIIGLFLMSFTATAIIDSNVPKIQITIPDKNICYLIDNNIFTGDNIFTGHNIFYNATFYNVTGINEVNDSQYLRGLTPQQVADLYVEIDPYYFSNPHGYLNESVNYDDTWINDTFYNTSQSDARYLQSFTELDPYYFSNPNNYTNESVDLSGYYNKTEIDGFEFTTNASALAYANSTGLIINWSGIGDTDTTYTAGNKLYLDGTEFNVNDTELNQFIEAYGYITIDTNETTRVNTIVGTNCGDGNYSYGFDSDGNIQCREDNNTDTIYDDTWINDTFYNTSQSDARYLQSFTELDPYYFSNPNNYTNESVDLSGYYNKTEIDGFEFTTNASALAYANSTGLIINWSGIGDTDTTYTAGTGLTLTGTEFTTNDSEINHDSLSGFVADEHIDWTNAANNISTTGSLTLTQSGTGDNFILSTGRYASGWDGGSLGTGTRLMWIPNKYAFRAGFVGSTQWDAANIGSFSSAVGRDSTASGDYSFATGYGTNASGESSFVGGRANTASAAYATVFGFSNTVASTYGFLAGYDNDIAADSSYSAGFGRAHTLSNQYTFAGGYGHTISGSASTAFGFGNTISGSYSTVLGRGGNVNADYSTLINLASTATTLSQPNTLAITNGNVAIGNTFNEGPFDDESTSLVKLRVGGSSTTTADAGQGVVQIRGYSNAANAVVGTLEFLDGRSDDSIAKITSSRDTTTIGLGNLRFYTSAGAGSLTERMRLDSTGLLNVAGYIKSETGYKAADGTAGWTGDCINTSYKNGLAVGCND